MSKKENPSPENIDVPVSDNTSCPCSECEQEESCKNAMQEQTDEQEAKLSELSDKLLRTAAEYDNYRKRTARERTEAYADATARAVAEFLPALDNLERALESPCTDENFRKGVEMTQASINEALTRLGVETFGEREEDFDPLVHNALSQVEDAQLGQNVISQVYQRGYKIGDKVIRHAAVIVANP